MNQQKSPNYEVVLRVIGQALENLGAIAFELEISEGEFVAGGESQKPRPISNKTRKKLFLKLIQSVVAIKCNHSPASLTFHFSGLRFNQTDIDQLNRKAKFLRSTAENRTFNPYSMPHILRMTGAYLDHTGFGLKKLSWRYPTLTLWHTNRRGVNVIKEFTLADMYDIWVHQFKKREPTAPLKLTGTD